MISLTDLFSHVKHSNPQNKPEPPQNQIPEQNLDSNIDVSLIREVLTTTYPDIQVPDVINFNSLAARYGYEQALNCVRGSDNIVHQSDSVVSSKSETESFKSKVDRWDCVRSRANSLESVNTQESLAFDNHISTVSLTSPIVDFSSDSSWETTDSLSIPTDKQTKQSGSADIYPQSNLSDQSIQDSLTSNMGGNSNDFDRRRGESKITVHQDRYSTYSGDLSEDHEAWARGYRAWAESACLTEDEMCRTFVTFLKSDALAKYYTWPREVRYNYDELERAFLDYWGSEERCSVWMMELQNLKMKEGDNVDSYIKKMCDLGRKLNLADKVVASHIVSNLPKRLKDAMLTHGTKKLSETIMQLKILDRGGVGEESETHKSTVVEKTASSAESSNNAAIAELAKGLQEMSKQMTGLQESVLSNALKTQTNHQELKSELSSVEKARNSAAVQQQVIDNTVCSHCRIKGHLLLDCQRYIAGLPAVEDSEPNSNVCNYCQIKGHQTLNCQRLSAGLPAVPAGQNMVMQVQGTGGHSNNGGFQYSDNFYDDGSCWTCGSFDHIQRFCPQNRPRGRGRGRGRGGRGRPYQSRGYYQNQQYGQNQQHPQQQVVYQQTPQAQVVTVPQPSQQAQVVTVPQQAPQPQVITVPQQVQAVPVQTQQPQYVQLIAAPAEPKN